MMDEAPPKPIKAKRPARVALKLWETSQWVVMRDALTNDRRIVCFDAEWEYQPPNRVTELGVAILHGRITTVHNVRVRGRGKAFNGGTTIHLAEDEAKSWLQEILASADLLVGHALQNDRLKMRQWKCPLPSVETLPMVDTGTWSRIVNQESANPRSLKHLADQYGISRKGMHVAGNDALVTLQVALAMAASEPNAPRPSDS